MILAVIPARGGSKGIPRKNLHLLAGKPLIQYSIEAAMGSTLRDNVIVSTDSEEIASVAKKLGALVPFLRPEPLATDTASTVDVLQHAILEMEKIKKTQVKWVVTLQPTAPLRTSKDIDACLDLFKTHTQAESLITVYEASAYHPQIMYRRSNEEWMQPLMETPPGGKRRQDFEPVYIRNGAIYISTRDLLISKGRVMTERPLAYVMPQDRSINIDEPRDLRLAEFMFSELKGRSEI